MHLHFKHTLVSYLVNKLQNSNTINIYYAKIKYSTNFYLKTLLLFFSYFLMLDTQFVDNNVKLKNSINLLPILIF